MNEIAIIENHQKRLRRFVMDMHYITESHSDISHLHKLCLNVEIAISMLDKMFSVEIQKLLDKETNES
jgi:hypothetical protein